MDSHKDAYQLHLNISPEGLKGALFSGSNIVSGEIVNEREVVANEDKLVDFFRGKTDRWIQLNETLEDELVSCQFDIVV